MWKRQLASKTKKCVREEYLLKLMLLEELVKLEKLGELGEIEELDNNKNSCFLRLFASQ